MGSGPRVRSRGQELLRQPPGAVRAQEHTAAEDLLDEPRVEVRELQELAILIECAVGDEGIHVGVEVGHVGAERLNRDNEARRDVVAIEDRADARHDRVAGRGSSEAGRPGGENGSRSERVDYR